MKSLSLAIIGMLSILFSCNIFQVFMPQTNETMIYVNNIFETSMDCILPCVIGLQIGDAPDADTISRLDGLEDLGGIREINNDVTTYYISTDPQGNFTSSIYYQTERIQAIELDLSSPEDWLATNPYTFDELLSQLSKPDEVYIIFFGPPAGYTLLLVYESERIVFRYRFIVEIPERFDGDAIPFCTLESSVTTLTRLSISVRNSDEDNWLLDIVPDLFDDRETRPWRRISDLTTFDHLNLFDNLRSETECLDLTTFEALQEMGYQY